MNFTLKADVYLDNASYYSYGSIKVSGKASTYTLAYNAYTYLMNNIVQEEHINLQLINCRNFIPRILLNNNYSSFNQARSEVFKRFNVNRYPTACGVCGYEDGFRLDYLAVADPNNYVKIFNNNIQTPPADYPLEYGNPPLFSRAGIFNENLFLSGTAAIIGSSTQYPNDFNNQWSVTWENINNILSQAQSHKYDHDLFYIVYIKNMDLKEIVQNLLKQKGIKKYSIKIADLCRSDLLVEIEAYSEKFYQTYMKDF